MNMMSLQEQREDSAVPLDASELDFDFDLGLDEGSDTPPATTTLERMKWFRNLSLRGKVHAIFGTFFGISFAMALVLGMGLGELWARYKSSVEANDAMFEAIELRGIASDMRYDAARFLLAGEEKVFLDERASFRDALQRVELIQRTADSSLPAFVPAVSELRDDLIAYDRAFTSLVDEQAAGADPARLDMLAQALARRGETLVADTHALADDFAAQRALSQDRGVAYAGYAVLILLVLAALGSAILMLGLRYLSSDFSRKIVEISSGMAQLSRGNREFQIEGHDRQDEIGEMLRSLEMFKRANR